MNQKAAQAFAIKHYTSILKAKRGIDNSTPRHYKHFSNHSKNSCITETYEKDRMSQKLSMKLKEIHVKPRSKSLKRQKQKNQKVKSLISAYSATTKFRDIHKQNIRIVDKFLSIKSNYSYEFSKKRSNKLKVYSKLLEKNKGHVKTQNQIFSMFQKAKVMRNRPHNFLSRPKSSSRTKSTKSIVRPLSAW